MTSIPRAFGLANASRKCFATRRGTTSLVSRPFLLLRIPDGLAEKGPGSHCMRARNYRLPGNLDLKRFLNKGQQNVIMNASKQLFHVSRIRHALSLLRSQRHILERFARFLDKRFGILQLLSIIHSHSRLFASYRLSKRLAQGTNAILFNGRIDSARTAQPFLHRFDGRNVCKHSQAGSITVIVF